MQIPEYSLLFNKLRMTTTRVVDIMGRLWKKIDGKWLMIRTPRLQSNSPIIEDYVVTKDGTLYHIDRQQEVALTMPCGREVKIRHLYHGNLSVVTEDNIALFYSPDLQLLEPPVHNVMGIITYLYCSYLRVLVRTDGSVVEAYPDINGSLIERLVEGPTIPVHEIVSCMEDRIITKNAMYAFFQDQVLEVKVGSPIDQVVSCYDYEAILDINGRLHLVDVNELFDTDDPQSNQGNGSQVESPIVIVNVAGIVQLHDMFKFGLMSSLGRIMTIDYNLNMGDADLPIEMFRRSY